jgi:hypothetical protein
MKTGWLLLLLASAPSAACLADPGVKAPGAEATSESAPELLRDAVASARREWEFSGFVRLAILGERSAGVAEELAELLGDPNPYVRVGACRTLGYTGRTDLWPKLTTAVKDQDWRVSFCACLGLARLKAEGALPSLEELAKSHWYPLVRDAADYSMTVIRGDTPGENQRERFGPLGDSDWCVVAEFDNFQSRDNRGIYPASGEVKRAVIKRDRRLSWDRHDNGRAKTVVGHAPPPPEPEIPTFRNQYPAEYAAVSLVTGKGQGMERISFCELTGRQEREGEKLLAFSGGLNFYGGLFVVSAEKAKLLLNRHVENLLDWDGRMVALTSMGTDDGVVVEIFREENGWGMRPLHALPGSPIQSGIWPDGRLFVNTSGGGVIIGKDGSFEFLGSGRPSR